MMRITSRADDGEIMIFGFQDRVRENPDSLRRYLPNLFPEDIIDLTETWCYSVWFHDDSNKNEIFKLPEMTTGRKEHHKSAFCFRRFFEVVMKASRRYYCCSRWTFCRTTWWRSWSSLTGWQFLFTFLSNLSTPRLSWMTDSRLKYIARETCGRTIWRKHLLRDSN